MVNDFVLDILNDALQDLLDEFRADGLSDSEIIDKLSDWKIENMLSKLTETISSDMVHTVKDTIHERVLDQRSNAEQFMAHNNQIWGNGFIVSEAMYLIALDAGNEINAYASTLAIEQYREIMFRYCVLGELYARACQQYLEIIHLIKGGFADGAYARWRSLFELSVVSEFIRNNDEEVAKAYHGASFTDDGRYGWAGVAPCFSGWKNPNKITFDNIKEQCSLATDAWNSQYKLANKIVHATPQGTFDRLGAPSGPRNCTPVGPSVYGLATPAVNAAISLSRIATDYFGFVASGDGIVYIKTISKWSDTVRKCYTEIERTCFEHQ